MTKRLATSTVRTKTCPRYLSCFSPPNFMFYFSFLSCFIYDHIFPVLHPCRGGGAYILMITVCTICLYSRVSLAYMYRTRLKSFDLFYVRCTSWTHTALASRPKSLRQCIALKTCAGKENTLSAGAEEGWNSKILCKKAKNFGTFVDYPHRPEYQSYWRSFCCHAGWESRGAQRCPQLRTAETIRRAEACISNTCIYQSETQGIFLLLPSIPTLA